MTVISFKLEEKLARRLKALSAATSKPLSVIVREAIAAKITQLIPPEELKEVVK